MRGDGFHGAVLGAARREGMDEGLVVAKHCKGVAFQEMPEVSDHEVDGQGLATKRATTCLLGFKLVRQERERVPRSVDMLLKCGANGCAGHVNYNGCGSIMARVEKK